MTIVCYDSCPRKTGTKNVEMARRFEIYLKEPVVKENKILFSWEPNYVFKESRYWVQYPEMETIECSKAILLEAYLPVCTAFAALGHVDIHLPGILNGVLLKGWGLLIQNIAGAAYSNQFNLKIINGSGQEQRKCGTEAKETGLLFGGGAESLLLLGRFMGKNIKPYLLSLGGPAWLGSDPNLNKDKFELDEKISKRFGLKLVKIRTKFRELIDDKKWLPYLKNGANILNSALFLPFNISVV